MFDEVVQRFRLDGAGRLLDLGCGTGQLVIPLAEHFAEAVGMDPEQEMLDRAARQAVAAKVANGALVPRWFDRPAGRPGALSTGHDGPLLPQDGP
ncbi:class I SAM-dependent methyltransferase [Actinomadura sp. 7K507]|uniref:class I SAM-dependent methyltransferase n=1 Tax=Actinomadura sp. 7K507 TaxID=2530365 RepID=UPI001045227F|nr:class I SAM-dependent methyltransferase [Actinomadura sp. 7K507]TDC75253.1 class I SAM-dependent methyltransferase [Actinomadura sp. 7K507]